MILLGIVVALVLSFPFGNVEATALSTSGGLQFEVVVEVFEPASAVLVRGVGPVDELPPVALVERGDGTWGGLVQMPVVEDILIGFELIPVGNSSSQVSGLHRLSELGVDPAIFETGRTSPPVVIVESTQESNGWLWLAGGVVAGGLALVLLWVWAEPNRSSD